MFRIAPDTPLRHPLLEIQVCEIGRRGGGKGKENTIRDEELLCIALSEPISEPYDRSR